MPRIEPTVGRIVLFRPGPNEQLYVGDPGGEPLAAIIAKVLAPDRINLCVFSDKGHANAILDVLLLQEGTDKPDEGVSYAEWMPYQKGQAAKAEKLEAQLADGDAAPETLTGAAGGAGTPPRVSSLQATDDKSAAVAVAPRVSLADIKGAISARYDFTADKAVGSGVPVVDPLKLLSICILVMQNGFTVIGKSAPASPANFDPELGREFAYDDAMRQLWPWMGFALRDRLAAMPPADQKNSAQ